MDISVEDIPVVPISAPLSTLSLTDPSASSSSGPRGLSSLNAPQSTQHSPDAAAPSKKPKRQRPRQQLSCAACHARKQKCDQKIPCSRCIKRGVGDQCYIQPAVSSKKSSKDSPQSEHNHSSESPASAPSPEDVPQLLARIARLEAALRRAKPGSNKRSAEASASGPGSASSAGDESESDDAETAAAALNELSTRPSDLNTTASSWHGGGTFTGMLSRKTAELVSQPSTTPSSSAAQFVLAFPPRQLCDFLLETLYSPAIGSLLMSHLAIPRNFLQSTYEQLMNWVAGMLLVPTLTPPAAPCSLAFIGLVNSMFALALTFLPTESYASVDGLTGNRAALEDSLAASAKSALDRSEADEPPDLWRLQGLLLVGVRTKTKGRPSVNYAMVSVAIRYAQSMGLHRAGGASSKIKPYEQEVRNRVWNSLYAYDRGSSFAFGRPHIVNDVHCDCPLPANASIDELDPNDPASIVSLPREVPTTWTCRILEIELSRLLGQIADRIFSPKAHTYSDVLDCDRLLIQFEQNLPRAFTSPTYDELEQWPYLIQHCRRINLQLIWYRSVLHRGYLLRAIPPQGKPDRYSRSRLAAVTLSTKMISYQRDIVLTLTKVQQKFFLFPFLLFDSAANLAMAVLQARTRKMAEEMDGWIVAAQDMLQSMGPDNLVACEGLICVRALRAQIARAIPTASLAPIQPDAPTTVELPYIGGTLNLSVPLAADQIPEPTFEQVGGDHQFKGFGQLIANMMGLDAPDLSGQQTANTVTGSGSPDTSQLPMSVDELASWGSGRVQPFEQAWTSENAAYQWPFGNENLEVGWHTDYSTVLPTNVQTWWNNRDLEDQVTG